jgi:hypothetical protein
VAAADALLRPGAGIAKRGDQPGVLEQHRQVAREHRRAALPLGEALDFVAQVGLEGGQADVALARGHHEVAGRLLQQARNRCSMSTSYWPKPTQIPPRASPPPGWCRSTCRSGSSG